MKTLRVIAVNVSHGGAESFLRVAHQLSKLKDGLILISFEVDAPIQNFITESLNQVIGKAAIEVKKNLLLENNQVYIIPNDQTFVIKLNKLHFDKAKKTTKAKPSNTLFQSLANSHATNTIGLILSAKKTGGLSSIESLYDKGGYIIVQEPETSEAEELPLAIIDTGKADVVLPPHKMADYISKTLKNIEKAKTEKKPKNLLQYRSDRKKTMSQTLFELNERIKEQACLYNISSIDEQSDTKEEIFEKSLEFIKNGFVHPNQTHIQIKFKNQYYHSKGFKKSKHQIYTFSPAIDDYPILIEVFLENCKVENGKDFLYEEQQLLNSAAKLIALKVNRKKSIALIEQGNKKIERIFNQSLDVICTIDEAGKFVDISAAAEQVWGYTPEELKGKSYMDLVFSEDIEITEKAATDALNDVFLKNFKNRYVRKDGKLITILWSAYWDEKDKLLYCVAKDATEIEEAEKALKESEARYRGFFESHTNYVIRTDIEGKYIYVNKKFVEDFGWLYPDGKIIGKDSMSSICEHDHKKVEQLVFKCFENPEQSFQIEIDKPGEDGSVLTTLWDFICITDTKGLPKEIQCSGINITKRIQNEKQLELKTQYLDTIAFMNSTILEKENWVEAVNISFARIGEVLNADRVYYFDNQYSYELNEWTINQKIEWCKDGVTSQIDNPYTHQVPFSMVKEFVSPLSKNLTFQHLTKDVKDSQLKEIFISQQIQSIIVLPIFVDKKFWGLIGVDDCKKERVWTKEENDFLRTITYNISNAIKRHLIHSALQNAYHEKDLILQSVGEGFTTLDENWVVHYWNKAAEDSIGLPKEKIVGKKLSEIFDRDTYSGFFNQYEHALKTRKSVHFEEYFPDTGSWIEVNAYPFEKGLSIFFKDITERKAIEENLKSLNDDLKKLTSELAISNKELEQFAYIASHDLQEPLRMISSLLTQLEKKYSQGLDEKAKKYIHLAVSGAKRMRQIIIDLLEFSRIGRIERAQSKVDLNELVHDLVRLMQEQIDESGIVLNIEKLPEVFTTSSLVRQIFQNLISNAIKYTKGKTEPKIHIRHQSLKKEWQFTVEDNGIGIDSEFFDKIFVIFQRLHLNNEYSGTGIGLAITKKAVEHLGGRIWVESTVGKGSTFHFTIPNHKK